MILIVKTTGIARGFRYQKKAADRPIVMVSGPPLASFYMKFQRIAKRRKALVFPAFRRGDLAGIRTPDPLLKRQLLCLLSYQVIMAGTAGFEPTISESKSGVLPLHYIPMDAAILYERQ